MKKGERRRGKTKNSGKGQVRSGGWEIGIAAHKPGVFEHVQQRGQKKITPHIIP